MDHLHVPTRHLISPLSIRLHTEKEKRLHFISKQTSKRCRINNCINWSAGEQNVGTVSMHRDIKAIERGLCWTHVKEQRQTRAAQRQTRSDGKLINSKIDTQQHRQQKHHHHQQQQQTQQIQHYQKRKYNDRHTYFLNNYTTTDSKSTTGLGLMLHSAIHLKDDEDIFTYLLQLKTPAGASRERIVVSALTKIRNSNGFLALQSAVNTRLNEQRVWQLYRRAPAAALDTAMEGLVAGLWAIEQINEYSTLLIRALLSQIPKKWLRDMLHRQRASYGTFIHRFVTHPSSQLATLNLLMVYATKACRWRDSLAQIPLHTACSSGGAPTIIDGLIQLDRESVKIIDKRGWPPLFSLVSSLESGRYTRGEIEMMLDALITASSPTLNHITHIGQTILHIMVMHQAPDWLLSRTMNECPGLVQSRDKSGKNILHLVCSGTLPRDIDQILRLHKNAPTEYDNDGRTPLWSLLMNTSYYGPEWRIRTILSILKCCPTAATHANPLVFDQIPIHYTLHLGWLDISKILVHRHPNKFSGLDIEDVRGEIPLHALLSRKGNFSNGNESATEKDIQWLCLTYPNGASKKTRKGHLPLHYAQQKRVPEYIKKWLIACHVGDSIGIKATQTKTLKAGIKLLTEHFPERATKRDAEGNLPLHYAIKGDCDPDVIQELIVLNPSTIHEPDAHGLPPMHLICTCGLNNNTLEHLQILHGSAPMAHKTLAYGKNLLHYACEHRQPIKIIRWILDLDQWMTQLRENLGKTPAHYAYNNQMYEHTKLLLSVFADIDDLLLRMNLEILRDALRARGCVFTVDTVGGNILHRLASNSKATHVLRAISWYQPWLCRQKNNNGQYPIEVAEQTGTKACCVPLKQAAKYRLPPEEGGEYYGNLSPTLKHSSHQADDCEEIRDANGSYLKKGDVFTDSDESDGDSDSNGGLLLTDMDPERAIRSLLEIFWVSMGKQPNGILEKLNACRTRQELTTYHLICDTIGRIRSSMPAFSNVPLLPILIPIRWMSEGYGSTENVQEVKASTLAVLRKAVGYKDLALDNITDFSHFRLYFLCEGSFLSLKNKETGLLNAFNEHSQCCNRGQRFSPVGGYEVKMPKFQSIVKIRPLIVLSLMILRCGLKAKEEHDEFDRYLQTQKEARKKESESRRDENESDDCVVTPFSNPNQYENENENNNQDMEELMEELMEEQHLTSKLSHGWGNCVPSLFIEFPQPLDSEDLALSYLIDVFASVYKTDEDRLNAFHPKELTVAFVELENIIGKYCKTKKTNNRLRNKKFQKMNQLKHVVHRISGKHLHVCEKHQLRDRNGLIVQEMDRKSVTKTRSKRRSKSSIYKFVEKKKMNNGNGRSNGNESKEEDDGANVEKEEEIEERQENTIEESGSFTDFIDRKKKEKKCVVQ